ncbi:terminase small subunit [Serratia marcescens]|uniref:terminase small subunit n=1 Tax=Serratia marcescens TaxID=615 RepID=UPI00124A2F9A|nr:terminase small subunit [Serratia marcescens]KAB1578753.1 terminase small subunit [Serratia marcescens]
MARVNWDDELARFAVEWQQTGVTPQDWSERVGHKWGTAKKYITEKAAKEFLRIRELSANDSRISRIDKSASELVNEEGLTDQQANFVVEYLEDSNATAAAIRAGYSKDTAGQIGYQLLQKTSIRTAIANQRKARLARQLFTVDEVLARMWAIATVDVNELVEYRRTCCRHCWGKNHDYQWTESEYNKARSEAEAKGKPLPAIAGGFGFRPKRAASPECPQCEGAGFGHVHIHATNALSPQARMAYQGVKTTKDGVEVLISNRDKMLENIARHLGVFDSPTVKRGQELDVERKEMENEQLRKELNQAGKREGLEDDYQLQVLNPDEPLPDKPIL